MISRDEFIAVYTAKLQHCFDTDPEYAYSASRSTAADLATRMYSSLLAGTANKDGAAIKATLKHFGVKHTYKAIHEALGVCEKIKNA